MKVLVVNLCDLGDVLFSTPLVEALAQSHEVHYLVDESCAAAVASNAHLARCWVLPRVDWGRRLRAEGSRAAALGEALAWGEELREQLFDVVYNLQPHPLAVELAHLAGGRQVRGFIREGGGVGVSPEGQVLRRHLQRFEARGEDGLHAAEGYLSLLPEAERAHARRLRFDVPPGVTAWAARGLDGPVRGQGLRLSVLPGAGDASKRWSPASWRGLLRAWHRWAPAGKVWILGGPDDRERGAELAYGLPWVEDRCGRLGLEQSAAVMAASDAVLGGDTGPLHLAAAVGTPCLGLFGPTHPAESGPLLKGSLSLKAGSGCMDDLPAGAVLRALWQLTQGRGWRPQAGVQLFPGRECETRRATDAWIWASSGAWLARQEKLDGKVQPRALASALDHKAQRGLQVLEGPALALDLAVESMRVKVLWEEKP